MVVLISSTVSVCRVKPKLKDGSFHISRLIPRPEISIFSGLSDTKKKKYAVLTKCLAVKKEQVVQSEERVKGTIFPKKAKNFMLSEGRDEDEEYGKLICPGCGIFMQDIDSDLPGFYQKRNVTVKNLKEEEEEEDELDEFEMVDDDDDEEEEYDEIKDSLEWEEIEEESDIELDGFAPAGVGYGNVTEETEEKKKKKRVSKSERKKIAREEAKKHDDDDDVTVCARCHSLRNYGQVKNQSAENLLPDFDFDRMISTRLIKRSSSSTTVVIMVVDCVDFDGSFPKRATKSLFKAFEKAENDPKVSRNLPKLVLVATKVDLLPSQISPTRLDRWIRHRAKAGGAPKLSGVYMVSSKKDLGIKNLLAYIKELAGPRGNVWVIGAQNAGKSTLINAFSKKDGGKVTRLTEAPVPGTTLGVLRIGGVLSAKAKMYDTPGLLHPYIMSLRLNSEERKMIEIRKELQPRTYRVKASSLLSTSNSFFKAKSLKL